MKEVETMKKIEKRFPVLILVDLMMKLIEECLHIIGKMTIEMLKFILRMVDVLFKGMNRTVRRLIRVS